MRFRWRGQWRRVRRSEGPERLAEEWWRRPPGETGPAHVRDYYRVEDEAGARYWLFRAGLYAATSPRNGGCMGWDDGKDASAPPKPPSPSWGGTGRKAARVGESRATTKRARELRKTLTPQEVRLWVQLRMMRADGVHFRRQAPLLGFYLDFICFKHRLIVEVDGSQHADDNRQIDHDAMRDAILARAGFRTLRFWNSDINENLDGVVQTIQLALQNPPSPSRGGTDDAQHRQGGGVGRDNDSSYRRRTAPRLPHPDRFAVCPSHEGEGGKGGEP